MKFKKLREATLTKTQIKKVHDKADDLPKNDFIKRYGKDGDSVRFATATKMVKKELGIEDYEEGFKSDAQRRAAFASGYKEKGKKKNEGGPGSGPRHKEVTLTRNGKTKTVKGVAAKIFTDAGWKVKKEEVELTEKKWPLSMYQGDGADTLNPMVLKIRKMTDRNDHFGARIELAKIAGDKKLQTAYEGLEIAHITAGNQAGNHAIMLREKIGPYLRASIVRKFGNQKGPVYASRLMDAL